MSGAVPLKPGALLLDTNVWINAQMGTHAGHAAARSLITGARRADVRLGIALHSLTDVFYVIYRELKRVNDATPKIAPERVVAAAKEAAWGVVVNIMDYAEVVGEDGSDARLAALHKALHDDFEDDLVFAAARRMGADLIVSDDRTLVKHSPLPALGVEDALRWLKG